MITIDGKEYENHTAYFSKYPWKRKEFKNKNQRVLAELRTKRCADCKLHYHPAAMTLDHTERDGYKNDKGKRVHPSNMVSYPPEIFLTEVNKCETVCKNCHGLREMERDGHLETGVWKDWQGVEREGALLI